MTRLVLLAPLPFLSACAIIPRPSDPQALFWQDLQALCGQAYPGRVVSTDPDDGQLAAATLVLHVFRCAPNSVRIAFHASQDASRVWVVARTANGLSLTHVHRDEAGREEVRSGYGGTTSAPGSARRQLFPANARTRALFRREGIAEAATNVWSLEIVTGQLLAYAIDRAGRHLRIEFDLGRPVRTPGPAWGER
ncbi:MAG TPA: hypothetical protein VEC11_15525 [Allosphingosinicella sp.]|nr:hypothetical protein [Allosphingosinicella sp.]